MKTLRLLPLLALAFFAFAPAASAQQKRTSPHETIGAVIDGNRVTVVYGRPNAKDPKTGEVRKIWGGLVPYGKVWRTGSDEATLLITQRPILFGATEIPAGAFTLWTIPAEDGSATLVINKEIGQWGITRAGVALRDEALDVAKIPLVKEAAEPAVEQFTIAVTKGTSGGGVLSLAWENLKYSAAFTVKK